MIRKHSNLIRENDKTRLSRAPLRPPKMERLSRRRNPAPASDCRWHCAYKFVNPPTQGCTLHPALPHPTNLHPPPHQTRRPTRSPLPPTPPQSPFSAGKPHTLHAGAPIKPNRTRHRRLTPPRAIRYISLLAARGVPSLGDGVTVAQQFLVLLAQVRMLIPQIPRSLPPRPFIPSRPSPPQESPLHFVQAESDSSETRVCAHYESSRLRC